MKKFKYGCYSEDVASMVNTKLAEMMERKLDDYGTADLSETTRDQLVALLDYLNGARVLAKAIIQELMIEVETE